MQATTVCRRFCIPAFTILTLSLFVHITAQGQGGDLVKQGPWTVSSPAGGCGSLPLLQVKGPGTLFDSANAAAFADLQRALQAPLATACPDVHEAILVNGRGRKLIKIQSGAPLSASAPSVSLAAPAPSASPIAPPPPATAPAAPVNSPSVTPTVASAPLGGSEIPVLPVRSSLPSLASSRGTQDKCDAALKWLETGKSAAPATRAAYGLPPEMIQIFRDETMTAVFGMPYDQADNRWRIEQYEKVFSKCMGEDRTASRPANIRGINLGQFQRPLPREYAQEFRQYSDVIHGAFEGTPGKFEPTSITRYVQGVRQQIALANSEMSSGAIAQPTLESFKQLQEYSSRTAQQLALLRPEEREAVNQYLNRRQSELAPGIIDAWLHEAAQNSKTPESAKTLEVEHRRLNEILARLAGTARVSADASYNGLIEADITQALNADTAKLSSFPASWEGAQQMGAWEAAFVSRFGDFQSSTPYHAAIAEFESARTRIYPLLLPAWQAKVTATPAKSADIAARRDELKAIFVAQADRSSPLYAEFEKPINVKESELQTRIAEDERRRLAEAERAEAQRAQAEAERTAAARGGRTGGESQTPAFNGRGGSSHTAPPVANGPLAISDLKLGGGPDADILRNLYTGEFDKIELDRSSVAFSAIVSGYIAGFWQGCHDYIQDPVELTEQECDAERTVTRGYTVVSRSCAHYQTVGTGVFAERSIYAALNSAPTQQVGSTMRTMLDAMSGRDPISGAMNLVANVSQLKADSQNTVAANSCTSPALTRFKDNLERFALGKEGKRLDGTISMGVAMLPPSPGETYRDSNYVRLLDDMVSEQGKSWAVNRYISGSIRGVSVIARDSSGRPAKVSGAYSYNGFSNRQEGNVTLSFDEGRPTCLYFSDQPSNCRTPDHRLTSNYLNGSYR